MSDSLPIGGTSIETVRRIGQALWMLIGSSVRQQDFAWARPLLGAEGPADLYSRLDRTGALIGPEKILSAEGLARFLCTLLPYSGTGAAESHLVWTLPPGMAEPEQDDDYCRAAVAVIETARKSIWLVSPFLEARGVGRLLQALHAALAKGVHVQVVTHGVESVTTQASRALEQLRRESSLLRANLTVYAVKPDAGLLVHSKLIVADEAVATLGSANLTDRGLSTNFEAGVVLSGSAAAEIVRMIERLMQSGLTERVFST